MFISHEVEMANDTAHLRAGHAKSLIT